MLKLLPAAAVLAALPLLAAACGSAPPPPPAPVAPPPDPHGVEADEFFVSGDALPEDWKGTIWAFIAKMEKPASGPAEGPTFYEVKGEGTTVKTKFFWKSHPAAKEELKPGVVVACFADASKDGLYGAPADKMASRNGRWFASHVTDTAELDKGVVRVGPDRCVLGSMRVLTPGDK